jgi:hypothetical protein
MKISIKIDYRDKVYQSEFAEYTNEQFEILTKLVAEMPKGNSAFSFNLTEKHHIYFPSKVLEHCIITIIKK